jgi:hypothetical protein
MATWPRWTNAVKALQLACWNTNEVWGRKLKLDHFFSQHGVDICLLIKTHLKSREVFQLTNYVCHGTDQPMEGSGTAMLFCRSIDHYAVPVLSLTQLETAAMHIVLVSGPVKLLAVSLSPSLPLIRSDLSA